MKSREQKTLEAHLSLAKDTAKSCNKFYWLTIGFLKKENEFMEYMTKERTIRRYSENDREFPLDKVLIHSVSDEKIDEATIHTGFSADEFTRSLHALAITIGKDIYFRNGAYKPETEEGRVTLAHELTHVNQNLEKISYTNKSKEELEKEAESNEKYGKYETDPIITKEIEGKRYSYKKSVWKKIKTLTLQRIEEYVESKKDLMPEREYLELLIKYDKWLETEALAWLI